jgi:hypothetical protein
MRVGKLLDGFEVRVAGEGPEAVVAELWHVVPVAPDAPSWTGSRQLAHLAASPRPPEPTQPGTPAYWRADVFFHTRAATELRDPGLTRAITDWLLSDTPASKPLLVQFHEAAGTHWDMRGGVGDGG